MADPPPAPQPDWRAALRLADRVLTAAAERPARVGLVELEGAVILADAAHNPAQLLSDDWTSTTDEDPELARQTRAALAAELVDSGLDVTMTHHGTFGRLLSGRRWEPVQRA